MVDFDKLGERERFDYLYRCHRCGSESWRWFELPLHLTDCCVLYPFEAGQRACPGPMQQVAMRRQEPWTGRRRLGK